jgi:transglutaminase/protease-like cytokinesis protein 3
MKTTKLKHIAFSLLLTSSLAFSNQAQANIFGIDFDKAKDSVSSFFGKAKEGTTEAAKKVGDAAKQAAEATRSAIDSALQGNKNPNEVEIVDLSFESTTEEKSSSSKSKNTVVIEDRSFESTTPVETPKIAETTRQEDKKSSDRKQTVNENETENSLIRVHGKVDADVQWILVQVQKDQFTETSTYAVKNGVYDYTIALRDGAGFYKVGIFVNRTAQRYVSYSYLTTRTVENRDTSDTESLLPSEMVQSTDASIVALAREIRAEARDDFEFVDLVNKRLAKMIKYDFPAYYDGSYANKPFDAISTLNAKTAVCSGYSNLVAAVLRAEGIKARVVNGKGFNGKSYEDHAWNEVYLDGEWRNLDVTWNSTALTNKYFFMDDAEFNKTHIKEKVMTNY